MESITSLTDLFPTTAPSATSANNAGELNQDDFMELMLAQLKNQDPTNPQDNAEFLAQISQFSTVTGIQDMVEGFGSLSSMLSSNQALEAANLVGHQVVTESNLGFLSSGQSLDATIELPSNAANVTLYVQDMTGRLVYSQGLGPAGAGNLNVQWDGLDVEGNPLPEGQYRVSAEANIGGQNQAASVYTHRQVESVTLDQSGAGGVLLNLAGGAQVGVSDVKSFL